MNPKNAQLFFQGSEQEVIPDTVNGAMGYDSSLSGTNSFWVNPQP